MVNNKENKSGDTEGKKGSGKFKLGRKSKIAILALIVLSLGVYAYSKYTSTDAYKAKNAEKETVALVKDVGELMVLPADENPAIFVVQDPSVLISQQLFFKGAEKGDKLMVYPKAGKAILYSTSKNMIINVGPVTFDQNTATAQSVTTAGGLQNTPTTGTTPVKKK